MGLKEVRDLAADLLRDAERTKRSQRTALGEERRRAEKAVLAAVEAFEVLESAAQAAGADLPPEAREPLEIAIRAAWERLAALGVTRDGARGEGFDPARHRVVRERVQPGASRGEVLSVVTLGVVWEQRRLRPAAVVVAEEE